MADAKAFWGDLVGEVDPFFDTWASAMQSAGLLSADAVASYRSQITVKYVTPGCFGAPGSARPTDAGLMYNPDELPVFGAPNRRWAEKVLNVWRGRG